MNSSITPSPDPAGPSPARQAEEILARYEKAAARRNGWSGLWSDCYAYALPARENAATLSNEAGNARRQDKQALQLFDGTACDAVEELAASLMAELTPPWSPWFELKPGTVADMSASAPDGSPAEPDLENASSILQVNFDRSNFAVEMHQCYLDLVTIGTACLMFEEAPFGERSAFRFTAIPMGEAVLEENSSGAPDTVMRRFTLKRGELLSRFPGALPDEETGRRSEEDTEYTVVEIVTPDPVFGHDYKAVLKTDSVKGVGAAIIAEGHYERSPFIAFRWMKAPGEVYGRSPVMKVLPDIKTANKVVELILKNASIAVTGIWQADDDGVLNPAAVRLVPGTIIPKAVGSSGLTPLRSPGDFDTSQLVLEDLRKRIRHGLMADQLGPIDAPRMTATEVMERAGRLARLLGATFSRLQAELLQPLGERAIAILQKRGEIGPFDLTDGSVELEVNSPIARANRQERAASALQWVEKLALLGPEAGGIVDRLAMARWLAEGFGVPEALLLPIPPAVDGGAGDLPL